ncbi:MAG: Hsp70 family protein [Acidobacteriaceae bacterium]|nr:Hsp70 family protein [Acidobacteriaceae bacterium]
MGVGLDFGTTNTSIALAEAAGPVKLARFASADGLTESFRSLLYLERVRTASRSTIKSWSGPEGIRHYLEADDKGRLIQSLKSFLASRSLQTTEIFGSSFTLESLIAKLLQDIRIAAEKQWGGPVRNAVVGRPVRFVGAESTEDDQHAATRLEKALRGAGFEEVSFEYEPVAAAYYYESTLDHDELILIGDFGGGTSDFSLLRVGPSLRKRSDEPRPVLGNAGVGLAGDAFDAKLIRHLVSPALGAGTCLRSGHKLLPVPNWVYFKLERWHHLSFLRAQETLNMLQSVKRQAVEPEKLGALLYLVKHDLGFPLHRAVQATKAALSKHDRSTFRFVDGPVELQAEVTRPEFESWIAPELGEIEGCIDSLLHQTAVDAREVNMVFLTGGSSFVPGVRRIFESRFGGSKIRTGGEFTSVAHGLALRSLLK